MSLECGECERDLRGGHASDCSRHPANRYAAKLSGAKFSIGDPVEKVSGSKWRGTVVGFYSTALTEIGYCVESHFERGSVQVYPESALTRWEDYYGC